MHKALMIKKRSKYSHTGEPTHKIQNTTRKRRYYPVITELMSTGNYRTH